MEVVVYQWVTSGDFQAAMGFLLDPLSAVMILVVTGVGLLIHIYSIGYMHGDEGFQRYFAYLNLFVFSMLLLVLGNNFLLMFLGWEGVGLCSYLLIGFWFTRQAAADAGKKAFIVNRVGDFGFLLGSLFDLRHLRQYPIRVRCSAAPPSSWSQAGQWRRRSRSCSFWARPASRRRFRCMSGCPMPWKALRP